MTLPQTDEARLRELAKIGARSRHTDYFVCRSLHEFIGDTPHVAPFSVCPHPDCVLVRRVVEETSQPQGLQTTLRDAIADLRQLVKTEAGHIAYFDDELDAVVAAALRQSAHPPAVEGTEAGASAQPVNYELRIEHARKQGAADGWQQGWHAALSRVLDGTPAYELQQMVPLVIAPAKEPQE